MNQKTTTIFLIHAVSHSTKTQEAENNE